MYIGLHIKPINSNRWHDINSGT